MILILGVCLGCGLSELVRKEVTGSENTNSNSNANKSLTDRAIETAVGEDKTGIAECDEVIDIFTAEADNPDDNIFTKAAKKAAFNKFREEIKARIEEQKVDKAELAKRCKEFKKNLDTSKTEEDSNKQ